MNKKSLGAILASIASISLATEIQAANKKQQAIKGTTKGECYGVNSCKGKGECGSPNWDCAGNNSCKGQGWLTKTSDECKKLGGKFKPDPAG